ncbi:MAG TPA: response regulator [Spirochaetales bacterium]|nr:response regulator [Spirochaetales bacterium]
MESVQHTVLITDDDPAIQKVLSLGLQRANFDVKIAHNGQEALDLLVENGLDPECILLDIRMPVMNGLVALPKIRALKPMTPVIMLTAYNDLSTGLEAMKSGAFDYLVKPSRLDHIVEVVNKAIKYRSIVKEKEAQDRKNAEYQSSLEKSVQSQMTELKNTYEKLQQANFQTVLALAEAIEAKDSYTQGHCQRVSRLSLRIARRLGLPKDMEQPLQYAALLHDIGKIGIPERILNKKGPLDEEEMEVIKMHPLIGAQILSIMDFFAPAINGVRHHHERWDGKGYPDGVAAEAIDPLARIIALADTFDAMATTRPYRNSKGLDEILLEIRAERGKQFSPVVVDAFFDGELYDEYIDTPSGIIYPTETLVLEGMKNPS